MFYIVTPPANQIIDLQDMEDHYYWSAAAEILLRGEGWVSVITSRPQAGMGAQVAIVTRWGKPELLGEQTPSCVFFEGPLAVETAETFDVQVNELPISSTVDVRWSSGKGEVLYYSQEYYRCPATGERRRGSAARWFAPGVRGQTFSAIDGWNVHLSIVDAATQRLKPTLISRDGVFLCGLPVLDLAVREIANAPVPARGLDRAANAASNRIVQDLLPLLIAQHRKHAEASPLARVRRWPNGYQAAVSVRHDYDRAISSDSINELLKLYEELDLKCSIGFLSYLASDADVGAFKRAGHEIQLHSHACDEESFGQALRTLRDIARGQIYGATVHGGATSIGFLGDTFYGWAEAAGLEYIEGFFNFANAPVTPMIRIGSAGIPMASCILGSRVHMSLDNSTKPGAPSRCAEVKAALQSTVEAGDYAIVINHPDLNRGPLSDILRSMDFRKIWRATQHEVADWFKTTYFDASATLIEGSLALQFPQKLTREVVVDLLWGGAQGQFTLLSIQQASFECKGGTIEPVVV